MSLPRLERWGAPAMRERAIATCDFRRAAALEFASWFQMNRESVIVFHHLLVNAITARLLAQLGSDD